MDGRHEQKIQPAYRKVLCEIYWPCVITSSKGTKMSCTKPCTASNRELKRLRHWYGFGTKTVVGEDTPVPFKTTGPF